MENLVHELINHEDGKIILLSINGNTLISESGKPDKLKRTEKEFPNEQEVQKNFLKKEWEALKKGYVLRNDNPNIGLPRLHYYVGGGYTGSLSLQGTDKGIFVYQNVVEANIWKGQLLLIDGQGNLLQSIPLPKQLAWEIAYQEGNQTLYLDLDHFIYAYDLESQEFENLGANKSDPSSFISVGTNRTVFASFGQLKSLDNDNKPFFDQAYSTVTIKGNTPFAGVVSPDGKKIAFHNKPGEISILHADNGDLIAHLKGDFQMIEKMEFTESGDLLLAQEQYGSWGMLYFDLINNQQITIPGLEIPEYSKEVSRFCLNPDQSKLVLSQRSNVHVFDFKAKKFLHSFRLDHIVKNCQLKFVNEYLGVRTDYGCFSLYKV
ncbi:MULTISPECIES: hypothetical protein [Sphingobacterium]|uniref:WD40 repeat domain-containing protein n=1 Tax=Sphingobacterium tenebrionis TaxID=3111775 RepID=A0ABU8IA38_9SPHI|nr:hypothetical protein [Sphingobacterium sp. 1.A.4]